MKTINVYPVERIIPLDDNNYEVFLRSAISSAMKRIWVYMFLINCYPPDDEELKVREIIKQLAVKKRTNLDVRVITDLARETNEIHNANKLSRLFMKYYGIECRFYSGSKESLHSKFILVDHNICIIGSHNLTHGALSQHRETSIGLVSEDLNIRLSQTFIREWEKSRENVKRIIVDN